MLNGVFFLADQQQQQILPETSGNLAPECHLAEVTVLDPIAQMLISHLFDKENFDFLHGPTKTAHTINWPRIKTGIVNFVSSIKQYHWCRISWSMNSCCSASIFWSDSVWSFNLSKASFFSTMSVCSCCCCCSRDLVTDFRLFLAPKAKIFSLSTSLETYGLVKSDADIPWNLQVGVSIQRHSSGTTRVPINPSNVRMKALLSILRH